MVVTEKTEGWDTSPTDSPDVQWLGSQAYERNEHSGIFYGVERLKGVCPDPTGREDLSLPHFRGNESSLTQVSCSESMKQVCVTFL